MILLFVGEEWYPWGGAHDYAASFDTVEAARSALDTIPDDDLGTSWANALDADSGLTVGAWRRKGPVWHWDDDDFINDPLRPAARVLRSP